MGPASPWNLGHLLWDSPHLFFQGERLKHVRLGDLPRPTALGAAQPGSFLTQGCGEIGLASQAGICQRQGHAPCPGFSHTRESRSNAAFPRERTRDHSQSYSQGGDSQAVDLSELNNPISAPRGVHRVPLFHSTGWARTIKADLAGKPGENPPYSMVPSLFR